MNKKAIGITIGTIIALGVGYFGGVGYYAEKFIPNTSYGPVSIANLTVEQAEAKINEVVAKQSVVLIENGHEIAKIALADLGYDFDAQAALQATYASQDPSTWFLNLFKGTKVQKVFADQVTIDEATIKGVLEANNISNEVRIPAINATLAYSQEKGYYVEEGVIGTQVDYTKLGKALLQSVEDGNNKVDLASVYAEPEVTSDSEEMIANLEYVDQVLNTQITLQIAGENVTIPRELVADWVVFDKNGELYVDGEKVAAYLYELDAQYSTVGTSRQFLSTLRGEVTVPPGILGWSIDIETETANIIDNLHAAEDIVRPAAFTGLGLRLGEANDIGTTYVEVDLVNQMMYLYVNNEIIVATNIVSGRPGSETIPGANAIISMETNTRLKGTNPDGSSYDVPVSYWMPFDYNAQGLHDASWQSAYGGDVHYYSGSLGCINTPLDQIAIIYQYVEYGTPVIVF